MGTRARGSKGESIDARRFLESRLQQGVRRVRGADLSTGTALLLLIWISFLLVGVMVDQLIELSAGIRLAALGVCTALSAGVAYWWIVRPLTARVNVLYTARSIESARPEMKNSFLNWAELSQRPAEIPEVILKSIESRAAQDVSKVKVEDAIQPRFVLPALYTVAGIIVLFCLYTQWTSKDLFASVKRVLLPMADVAPPTSTQLRLTFDPGAKTGSEPVPLPAGGSLTIKGTLVRGRPETITAYVRAEGTDYDEPHPFLPTSIDSEFVLTLPKRQKSFDLKVVAGDFHSRDYRIVVTAAPMITDWLLTYTPPPYTGEEPFTSTQPDIDALEGTKVVIEATSNLPVRPTGNVIELVDRTIDLRVLEGSDVKLVGEMVLKKEGTYRLKFQDTQGRSPDFRPIHHIRVRTDQPPQIEFTLPSALESEHPATQAIELEAKVTDDFGLRTTRLVAEKTPGGEVLLDREQGGPGESLGRKVSWTESIPPEVHRGQPGDVIEYWIEAIDSKLPISHEVSSRSQRRRIKIVAPPPLPEDRSAEPSTPRDEQTPVARDQKENPSPAEPGSPADEAPTDVAQGSGKDPGATSADPSKEPSSPSSAASKDPSASGNSPAGDGTDQMSEADRQAVRKLQKFFDKEKQEASKETRPSDETKSSSNESAASSAGDDQKSSAEQTSPGNSKSAERSTNSSRSAPPADDSSSSSPGSDGDAGTSADQKKPGSDQRSSGKGEGSPPQAGSTPEGTGPASASDAPPKEPSGNDRSEAKGSAGGADSPPGGEPSQSSESESASGAKGSSAGKEKPTGAPSSSSEDKGPEDSSASGADSSQTKDRKETKDASANSPANAPPAPPAEGSSNAPRSNKQGGNDDASAAPPGNTDGSASQTETGTPKPGDGGEKAAGQDGQPDAVRSAPGSDEGTPAESSSQNSSPDASQESPQSGSPTEPSSPSKSSEGSPKSGDEPASGDSAPDPQGSSSAKGAKPDSKKNAGENRSAEPSSPGEADPGRSNPGESGGQPGAGSKSGSPSDRPAEGNPNSGTPGGGKPSESPSAAGPAEGAPAEKRDGAGEKANEADRAEGSNLILRRLEEELRDRKVDPELLKEMGWTEEDAKLFAERLRLAEEESAKAVPLNSNERRGFGQGTQLRRSTSRAAGTQADQMQDLFSGRRTPPPAEVRKRYEAYMKSLSAEGSGTDPKKP